MLVFVRVVVESLRRVEEWSAISIIFPFPEQVVSVVSNLLIERLVHWESLALRKGEHLF